MFGVNLRNKFPFYAAIIGSAVAAIFITLNGVLAPAIGIGGLPAFISIIPEIDSNVYCRNDYRSCNPIYVNVVICKASKTEVGGS